MKKLVKGIVDFRQKTWPSYKDMFARLALGQSPDTLFIACSDSRVVPNLFASSDPGDLFVVRNVGNLIPCCGADGHSSADESEAAAIEFAISQLGVKDIIVCGHSECGAMQALMRGRDSVASPNLKAWLRHAEPSLAHMGQPLGAGVEMSPENRLSQLNVLQQLEHLKSYPMVDEKIRQKKLGLHGWWFELKTASVYSFEEELNQFVLIDEKQAALILARLG